MDVIYSANDHYARHLAVSMYSLLDHNRQVEKLRVFILSSGIEGDSQQKLRSVAGQFQRELILIDMGDLRRRFPCQVDTGGFDISAMGRLFLGRFCRKRWSGCSIWTAIPWLWTRWSRCDRRRWREICWER